MFAGKKSAQIREILISESAWEEMTCLFAPSLGNVLNPKMGIFYVSFLPQFIPHGQPLIIWTFGLVMIHVVLGTIWSTTLIAATRPLSSFLRKEAVIRWMDRTTGVVFLLFATRLALSKR